MHPVIPEEAAVEVVGGGGGNSAGGIGLGVLYDLFIAELEAWQKKTHKPNHYKKLTRDEDWPKWLVRFQRQAREDAYERVLNKNLEFKLCSIGADQDLWSLEVNFLAMVLEYCLETSIG